MNLFDEGMKLLSQTNYPRVQKLNLWRCNFATEGIYHFSKMRLTNLEVLLLGGNEFGPEGMKILV